MRYHFRLLIFLLLLGGSTITGARTINVLFLGNSYTQYNNLSDILEQLAQQGGDTIYALRNTPGGYSLWQHLSNSSSLELISEGSWDYVILQEQSQHPVIPYYRDNFTYPAADSLNQLIHMHNPCATTVFYMTWGRKYGGQQCIGNHCSPEFTDFFHMQDSLASAYLHMAVENEAFCAPVGISWSNSIANGDPIELFASDASHPSLAGSYLAACTFYAAILDKSPIGLEYTAGLSLDDAIYLQQIADYTVLSNPQQWNIIHPEPILASYTFELDGLRADFSNTSINATEYHWNFGDPSSGLLNSSNQENPSHEFTAAGTYVVSLTAGSPCLEEELYSGTLTILGTVLAEDEKPVQLMVFPNPASDHIIIRSKKNYNAFRIIDGSGKLCLSGEVDMQNGSAQISTSTLTTGIYFLHLSGSKGQYTQKILIR